MDKTWHPEVIDTKYKILFPIELSEFSESTIQWASRFLSNTDTTIYCLSVVKSLDRMQDIDKTEQMLERAKKRFEKEGFRIIKSEFIVNKNISTAICDYANREAIDHIIMGTHGRPYTHTPIGSISQSVIQKAKQPVLVIKNPHFPMTEIPELKATRVSPYSLREQIVNVLIPVVNEKTAETLIPLMENLLNKQAAVVHMLHAVTYDTENVGYINRKLDNAPLILKKNKQALQNAGYWIENAEYRVGEVNTVISHYAKEKSMDKIVLLSRQRNHLEKFLFGSVSNDLLKQDKYNVLVFSSGKGNRRLTRQYHTRKMQERVHPSLR